MSTIFIVTGLFFTLTHVAFQNKKKKYYLGTDWLLLLGGESFPFVGTSKTSEDGFCEMLKEGGV